MMAQTTLQDPQKEPLGASQKKDVSFKGGIGSYRARMGFIELYRAYIGFRIWGLPKIRGTILAGSP